MCAIPLEATFVIVCRIVTYLSLRLICVCSRRFFFVRLSVLRVHFIFMFIQIHGFITDFWSEWKLYILFAIKMIKMCSFLLCFTLECAVFAFLAPYALIVLMYMNLIVRCTCSTRSICLRYSFFSLHARIMWSISIFSLLVVCICIPFEWKFLWIFQL